ncbi:hypothetical protein BESB_020250 [Besnoitia besnoiti]|uniref:Rab-GAP TBC domain-containing protein n=1 Tax=Besnoitia besnoiti TaxID=94643 RepID=A0A2A9M4D6_BESBE|nr:hypothetical protein BESB_020250 [Besnoitia besnoiti]PFH32084.1 hypothetical protein BESB_020250 [Besnoitia besnoiti]
MALSSVSPSPSADSASAAPGEVPERSLSSVLSSATSYTALNRQRRSEAASRPPLAAYEACNYFLPFAAVSAACAPHQRYEVAHPAASSPGDSAAPVASSASLSLAAQAAFSAAPCCDCPRGVAGDCRRLRAWERMARVDAVQVPGLYEKIVAMMEKKVRVLAHAQGDTAAETGEAAETAAAATPASREKAMEGARERLHTAEEGDATSRRTAEGGAERRCGKQTACDEEEDEQDAFWEVEGRGEGARGRSQRRDREGDGERAHAGQRPGKTRETPDANAGGEGRAKAGKKDAAETSVCELLLGSTVYNAIEMDVHRTFPSLPFFKEEGQTVMRRVLQAYAVFDPEVGYVQGMNFVVGALLHHSNTCIHWNSNASAGGVMSLLLSSTSDDALSSPRTSFLRASLAESQGENEGLLFCIRTREGRVFWLLVSMFYLYDMRRMFLPALPGVFEKCDRLERMMQIVLPDLVAHLHNAGVSLPLLTSDWLLTLFSYSVPLSVCTTVWTKFFEEGWVFIYKLVIARFKRVKRQMCNQTDLVELVKTAKYAAPQSALAAVGESVVNWMLPNPHGGSDGGRRAANSDSSARSYLTSLGLLLQQQLQQQGTPQDLPSGLSYISNDPNASGSKTMWRDIIDDATDLNVDGRLFLQIELEMLDKQRVTSREQRGVGEPSAAMQDAVDARLRAMEVSGASADEEKPTEARQGAEELRSLGHVGAPSATQRRCCETLTRGGSPSKATEAESPTRKKTVGLWRPRAAEKRNEEGSAGDRAETAGASQATGHEREAPDGDTQTEGGRPRAEDAAGPRETSAEATARQQDGEDEREGQREEASLSTSAAQADGNEEASRDTTTARGLTAPSNGVPVCVRNAASESNGASFPPEKEDSTRPPSLTQPPSLQTSEGVAQQRAPSCPKDAPEQLQKSASPPPRSPPPPARSMEGPDADSKDSGHLVCSPLLQMDRCLALLRQFSEEDVIAETEEVCAECFAHQKLLFHVAEQRQHLQQLALEALKKPKQVPDTLRHWTARGAEAYDE